MRCWGANLTSADTGSTLVTRAVAVEGLRGVASIAVGSRRACALLRDGTMRCWGENLNGELGDGTLVARTAPTPVVDLRDAVQIGVGGNSCALLADGTVWCWGYTPAAGRVLTPAPVAGLRDVIEIAVGGARACVHLRDRAVRCWSTSGAQL